MELNDIVLVCVPDTETKDASAWKRPEPTTDADKKQYAIDDFMHKVKRVGAVGQVIDIQEGLIKLHWLFRPENTYTPIAWWGEEQLVKVCNLFEPHKVFPKETPEMLYDGTQNLFKQFATLHIEQLLLINEDDRVDELKRYCSLMAAMTADLFFSEYVNVNM